MLLKIKLLKEVGLAPTFCLWGSVKVRILMMRHAPAHLQQLIQPAINALGYELLGIEYAPQGRGSLLRIYIDSPQGVGVDDCQRVSHQVSGVLDVEDPIQGRYTLEVSSPGLDRPLFSAQDFARFSGQSAKVRLTMPVNGQRNFTGVLQGVRDGQVLIEQDGVQVALPLNDIDKARLVPNI